MCPRTSQNYINRKHRSQNKLDLHKLKREVPRHFGVIRTENTGHNISEGVYFIYQMTKDFLETSNIKAVKKRDPAKFECVAAKKKKSLPLAVREQDSSDLLIR